MPLSDLGLNRGLLVTLVAWYVVSSVVTAVGDPAYVARQEVSFMFAKDMTASVARVVLLLMLAGTGASGLFGVAVAYVSVSATIDLIVLRVRLRQFKTPERHAPFGLLRRHFAFALGSQSAALVSAIPTYTTPTLVAALIGARSSAYVAIPLQIGALLTVIPSMTAQSLLAELSRDPSAVVVTTTRALRGAYVVTLPAAVLLVIGAPYVLAVFGATYSAHGTPFLRWIAAGGIFFVFNYVSDIVLLARHKLRAYVIVNVLGAVEMMVLIVVALEHGLRWIGPAWFIGQGLYAAISVIALFGYLGKGGNAGRPLNDPATAEHSEAVGSRLTVSERSRGRPAGMRCLLAAGFRQPCGSSAGADASSLGYRETHSAIVPTTVLRIQHERLGHAGAMAACRKRQAAVEPIRCNGSGVPRGATGRRQVRRSWRRPPMRVRAGGAQRAWRAPDLCRHLCRGTRVEPCSRRCNGCGRLNRASVWRR